ncbi:uncharacterized protein [Acropora muricata]|uniref:uncharacterized protein n=1 Tax=Acropora muricata TaxID=159855 RepID=UPI0034E54F44
MEFKAFVLCLAFFVVTASGATVCKCAEKKDAVSKYTVEVDYGKTKVDETVEIDTDKETEAIHVPDNGDTDPGAPGEVDAIFDFKQNMAMHRLSRQKACFLSNSTDKLPKPADLRNLLEAVSNTSCVCSTTASQTDRVRIGSFLHGSGRYGQPQTQEGGIHKTGQGSAKVKASSTTEYVVTGTLNDRSILSDEMANLCVKFPIYLINMKRLGVSVENLERQKRRMCYYVYIRYCWANVCPYIVGVIRCW